VRLLLLSLLAIACDDERCIGPDPEYSCTPSTEPISSGCAGGPVANDGAAGIHRWNPDLYFEYNCRAEKPGCFDEDQRRIGGTYWCQNGVWIEPL